MQTFLPFESFIASIELLDKRRCIKQVVEAHQILGILHGKTRGYENHPAVRMWRGYEECLKMYFNLALAHTVVHHGVKWKKLKLLKLKASYERPPWLGDRAFHESHLSNLYYKAMMDDSPELMNNMERAQVDIDAFREYVWPV